MVWGEVVCCDVLWYGVVWCGVECAWSCVVWFGVRWCGVVRVRSGDAKGNALSIFTLCFLRHVSRLVGSYVYSPLIGFALVSLSLCSVLMSHSRHEIRYSTMFHFIF